MVATLRSAPAFSGLYAARAGAEAPIRRSTGLLAFHEASRRPPATSRLYERNRPIFGCEPDFLRLERPRSGLRTLRCGVTLARGSGRDHIRGRPPFPARRRVACVASVSTGSRRGHAPAWATAGRRRPEHPRCPPRSSSRGHSSAATPSTHDEPGHRFSPGHPGARRLNPRGEARGIP